MNPKHPSPDDPGRPADAGADPLDLAQVEQQLRRVQPRPPELDVEAILSAARTEDQPVVLANRPNPEHGPQTYRRMGTLAASWACGALAGALVTFIVFSRAAPLETPPAVRATVDNELPKVAGSDKETAAGADTQLARSDDTPPSRPARSRDESRVFVMLLDPYGFDGSPYAERMRPLRAGMFLLPVVPEGPWRFRHVTDAVPREGVATPGPSGDAQSAPTARPAPARATTREELLRELLSASPGSVL